MTVGTGIASAETPEEILNLACNDFEPNPDPLAVPPRVSDCGGATLTDKTLTGANLAGANLFGAKMAGATLTGANLNGANLFAVNLTDATLTNATLIDADLSSGILTGATLTDVDLSGAALNYVNLVGANLTGANLTGADLGYAALDGASLDGANLTDAILTGTSALPSDVHVAATSIDGAPVTWTAPTMPTFPSGLTLGGCDHTSGAMFPVGYTPVTCTVTSLWQGDQTSGSGTFIARVYPYIEPVAPVFVDTEPVTLSGTVGAELPYTFAVTGTPFPQVTVTAGALPTGLSLSTDGVLSGAPAAAGPFSFTITAANGTAPDATLQVNGTIAAATPAQIITTVCGNYVANPAPGSVTDCSGRDLSRENLAGANLAGANLANTALAGAILTGVDLTRANLTGANLEGATLTGVILTGANLTGTSAIPADVTAAATSAAGVPTTWATPAMPAGLTFGTCTPASGTVFPVGPTVVTCTVTSVTGDVLTTGTGTFTVTVASTPVVDPPATGSLGSLGSIFGG